jgi:putative ABC transport system substrate-binding protein
MRRRDFMAGLASAAAWPLAARAQQPALPVIGILSPGSPESDAPRLSPLRFGLGEAGYVEGRNATTQYRGADGQNDRLPALAADLAQRRVSVMVALGGTPAALAAKAATATIPIVFVTAGDPIAVGLVTSLSRPGGNITGIASLAVELGPKQLELLHELVPAVTTVGLLVNPTNATNAEMLLRELQAATRTLGLQLHVLQASTEPELERAFATLVQLRAGALVIGSDPFFNSRSEQLASLAARHAVPAVYPFHEYARAGGLMSYGSSFVEPYRLAGVYTGRILKGEKPADLPVQQSTKVELVINLKTAKALGLTIPETLLATADQVIE